MSFHRWLQNLRAALTPSRGERPQRGSPWAATYRPNLEVLEGRLTPSFTWMGTFSAGPTPPYAVVTGDFNNDGTIDVATAADTFNLLPGNGDGWLWSPVPIADFPPIPPEQPADFTSDGIPDLISVNGLGGGVVVRPGRGDGTFGDPIYSGDSGHDGLVAWKTVDLNGDGRLDLVLAYSTMDMGGMGSSLLGRGDGTFGQWEDFGLGLDPRTLAIGDFDNDGRVDLLVVDSEGAPLLLHNQEGHAGHWFGARLIGTHANRSGYGAVVTATMAGRSLVRACRADGSYMSCSDARVHVGLGAATRVDSLTVRWPGGHVDTFHDLPADRYVTLRESHPAPE